MTVRTISTMGTPVPYITLSELKRSPIYTQLQQLVPDSSPADRDAELERIIARVSAMINDEVMQNLAATVDVEVGQITVASDGDLRIHTRCSPLVSVQSVSVGSSLYCLTPITDLSYAVLEPWRITIPRPSGQVPGLFNSWGRPGRRLWAEWTYVNGFPISKFASASLAGDTSITVVDSTGIVPNRTLLTIEDGISLEQTVPTAVTGNVLTVPALSFAHSAGVGIHSLPGTIKEATLLLISRLHDTWSLSMGAITLDGTGAKIPGGTAVRAMCDAAWMLNPYKRRW